MSFYLDNEDAPYPVLAAHHQTNRQPHALDSEHLRHACHIQSKSSETQTQPHRPSLAHHTHSTHTHKASNDGTVNDDDTHDEGDAEKAATDKNILPKKRATRNSTASDIKKTQMAYYKHDAAWTDILESAKNEYRLHIHTRDPFPERTQSTLRRAGVCVLEMIAAYENDPSNEEEHDDSKGFLFCRSV
jgi:hypothetical protein